MHGAPVHSSLLGWLIMLAITLSILLRRNKDRRQWLFIGLSGVLTAYYLFVFLYHWFGVPWFERVASVVAICIPISAFYFFETFAVHKSLRRRWRRMAIGTGMVLTAAITYPNSLRPALAPALLAYVLGFSLVALIDLSVLARAATRLESTRIRYLVVGGFAVLVLQALEHVGHVAPVTMPPVGLAATLVYLYMISQSIIRHRILDLYEMLGRLAVLSLMGILLAIIYAILVSKTGAGGGLLLNAFLASLVILLLFDPLRDLVEQKISDFFFGERRVFEQALSDLRFRLAHVFDLDTMGALLHAGLEESRAVTHASLYLIDPMGQGYQLFRWVGPKPELDRIELAVARKHLRIQAAHQALNAAILQRRKELSLQTGKDVVAAELSETLAVMDKMNADLVFPLEGDQDVLGFLGIRDDRIRDGFSNEEIQWFGQLASQIAITVENSQVYQQMKERDRLAALGQMSAGLAHEIRNPLGAIKAAAQFLEEDVQEAGGSGPEATYLNIIVEEVNRLNRVVNNFLAYARPPKGAPSQVDILDILHRTIQVASADRTHQLDISVQSEGELPPVYVDGERLHQVFLNLIINARQATEGQEDARLEISTKVRKLRRFHKDAMEFKDARFVEIRFADNGPGIDPAQAKDIFIPFFTTKSSGSGLGLAICQRIIEDAGGEIEVRSQSGQGAIFSVVLPVREPDGAS